MTTATAAPESESKRERRSADPAVESRQAGAPAGLPLFLQRTPGSNLGGELGGPRALRTLARVSHPALIQRKCAACATGAVCPKCAEEEEQRRVQAKEQSGAAPGSQAMAAPRGSLLSGGGRPLPAHVGALLSRSFGADLAGVRVHTDVAAERSAFRLNARAFTAGADIGFGRGDTNRNYPAVACSWRMRWRMSSSSRADRERAAAL